ncbi:siderophore-interacting protein [uncultured Tateyamaria sp.]|uniref:siderophore-interacting protein n=1 Tax=uncultured Tateyamaria sp. TaxID=455651 RepID=UPI002630DED2|nr:siderophore-interacting protein [uncultured Tateyamaria sp.]
MNVLATARKKLSTLSGRPQPRILTVKKAWYLTPNMIRVTFAGPELEGFPEGREGGNCKLMLPDVGESRGAFAARFQGGPAPLRRTYTVRHYRADTQELDIDFVAHGDNGPASRWASHATAGDFLGFMGPSPAKVTSFDADWYLVVADPSALPIAAATLEAMPRDAKGVAVFEITAAEDRQQIDAPEGIDMHWLVHPDPSTPSTQQVDFVQGLDWPEGRVQTCIAGVSVIKWFETDGGLTLRSRRSSGLS